AILLNLFWDEVPSRDLDLLLLGVAGKRDDLHSVAKRGLHRVEDVRRGHEHHVRQIESDAEIVVTKRRVLFRIKHLEKSARWVAAKICPDLVDLIEHDQRVVRSSLLDRLDYAAGHRTDVSPAMTADLGLVVQTTK